MSRSYKHTPISSYASSGGQKLYRSLENRAKRRRVKLNLIGGREMPHEKEYGNEWSSPRDGKKWFGRPFLHYRWFRYTEKEQLQEYERGMRK